jgi:2-oxoglutarate/2-oxoacid ferredoxin oxidoreductase subunit alpha
LLDAARLRGVQTHAVPFAEITRALAQRLQVPEAVTDRTLNTAAVAVSCALLAYDQGSLARALTKAFAGRPRVIDMNLQVVELTYDHVRTALAAQDFPFRLIPRETHEQRLLVNGTQAVALRKLAAGMTFQTCYPISPATDESVYLEAHESFPTVDGAEGSVLVVQTEDELAAVTMASGAALTAVGGLLPAA